MGERSWKIERELPSGLRRRRATRERAWRLVQGTIGGGSEVRGRKKGSGAAAGADSHNIELGKRGEDAAARFLYRRGYEIVERNWTCSAGEADIIARDEEWVVFVEVKTRSSCEKGVSLGGGGP